MIEQASCTVFRQALLQMIAKDVFKIALFTSAAELGKETKAYDSSDEVPANGDYQAGGQVLTGLVVGVDDDVVYLNWDNPRWLVTTVTARGALIYDASRGNLAVAVIDFGRDVSCTNDSFTINLPYPGKMTAIVRMP